MPYSLATYEISCEHAIQLNTIGSEPTSSFSTVTLNTRPLFHAQQIQNFRILLLFILGCTCVASLVCPWRHF